MARVVLGSRLETVSVTQRPAREGEAGGQFVIKTGAPRREVVKVPIPDEIAKRGRDLAAVRSAQRAALALRYQTDKVYQFVERQKEIVRDQQRREKATASEMIKRQFGAARAAQFASEAGAARLRVRLAARLLGQHKIG